MPQLKICKCGHYHTQHNNIECPPVGQSVSILQIVGHGDCKYCSCEQFSWVRFEER